MPQGNFVTLACDTCKKRTYVGVHKNKKTVQKKLEFKKYCKHCRKHTLHKEIKK